LGHGLKRKDVEDGKRHTEVGDYKRSSRLIIITGGYTE
jgi:hypothetical protein